MYKYLSTLKYQHSDASKLLSPSSSLCGPRLPSGGGARASRPPAPSPSNVGSCYRIRDLYIIVSNG